jgi:hypothetical protein
LLNVAAEWILSKKKILDIGASVCQTADIMRQIWPLANILLFEGNAECEKLYQKQLLKL